MDANRNRHGKTVRVGAETSDRLDKLRHKGQSYDGLIAELLDIYESHATRDHNIRSPKKTRNKDGSVEEGNGH
jgi:hypothetical protein